MEIKIGADKIIEVLEGIKKKTKLDRYEEMVVTELMIILQESMEPETQQSEEVEPIAIIPEVKTSHTIDKDGVVKTVMSRTNPKGLDLNTWIKESIAIAQKPPLSIKTVPKSTSPAEFYDWLLLNGIIDENGNPKGR